MDLAALLGGRMDPNAENTRDTSETLHISSLALLKMLKHSRAGIPMEVMGLMLGTVVDDYTVEVVDVFAMPQSGSSVSVESVDPVFQTQMLDMLKQTGRNEVVVGWYHSHPGFGCWLSSVDVNTQQSFEQLNPRSIAVVVDPIQSVKGKVVMDAFRLITMASPNRQTTSNVGNIVLPSINALMHNLNRAYYSIVIESRKNELEQHMLMSLHSETWTSGLKVKKWDEQEKFNVEALKDMLRLTKDYQKRIDEEEGKSPLEIVVATAGKLDPKKNIEAKVEEILANNISQTLGSMLGSISFSETPYVV